MQAVDPAPDGQQNTEQSQAMQLVDLESELSALRESCDELRETRSTLEETVKSKQQQNLELEVHTSKLQSTKAVLQDEILEKEKLIIKVSIRAMSAVTVECRTAWCATTVMNC